MVPWGLLHVYDFMEGWDTSRETAEPTKHETYSGRKYLTTYLEQSALTEMVCRILILAMQSLGKDMRLF